MNLLIKSKTKDPAMKESKPQLYHGHIKIELKNVRTGSREKIESDNAFTLGINNHILGRGYAGNSPWENPTWRNRKLYRNLLGGIFLFDNEIEAVNGGYPTIMPAGTKMVANGSYGVSNSTNVTELGSYNSVESNFNNSALTFVYDWTTSQGNGNIACVSLTSDVGGYIGYGNSTSNQAHSTRKSLFENQSVSQIGNRSTYAISLANEILYKITTVDMEGSFTYTKDRLAIDTVSLFDFSESVTVELPNTMRGPNRMLCDGVDGTFLNCPTSITAGTSYTIGVYDIENDSWSYTTFTSPKTLSLDRRGCTGLKNKCILLSQNSENVHVYYSTGDTYVSQTYTYRRFEISDNLIIGTGGSVPCMIYDLVNDTMLYTNGSPMPYGTYADYKVYDRNRICYTESSDKGGIYLARNPLYLATVNNLDEPVTKTASQTMKVTYTVTPAA